jgi:hypothetical protein
MRQRGTAGHLNYTINFKLILVICIFVIVIGFAVTFLYFVHFAITLFSAALNGFRLQHQ